MALLTTYGAGNRVIQNEKTVTYSRTKIQGQWEFASGTQISAIYEAWEYKRTCAKSYSYVGMDKATAESCAAAMVAYYTRSTKVSSWNASGQTFTDEDGGDVCMAEITVQHNEGTMYSVVINVREEDTRIRTSVNTPSALFTVEDARGYDED